jgi:hypothetical protein
MLIVQDTTRQPHRGPGWSKTKTMVFNVQILNTARFFSITAKQVPSTPITAQLYAELGMPFY